jgi:hypothetical protein
MNGARWNEVKAQIARGETPNGCINCLEREQATGWSVRKAQFDARATGNDSWSKGLTQLEIASSNLCNLACTHCSSTFSSRWTELNVKFGKGLEFHHAGAAKGKQAPNPRNLVRQIADQDLSHLEMVRFKGGEPMLNRDVTAVLRHLLERGVLQNVSADFVSNGSIVNKQVLDLLHHARHVTMCVSVDGLGALQEYIRRGPSEIARIETFLDTFSALERITFTLNVSVMAYNVFSLDRITGWWNTLSLKYPGKFSPIEYSLHVVDPARLSVNVLQDSTREQLIRKYRHASGADYSCVIQALQQPFGGAALHNDFVSYTREMDRLWNSDVLQVVPELGPEMELLDMSAKRTSKWSLSFTPAVESTDETVKEGMSLIRAGKYEQSLRLYDRYLEAGSRRLERTWEVRLCRAIVLGKMEKWEQSLAEFEALVSLSPERTLQALEQSEKTGQGSFLGAFSVNLAQETGFARAPLFSLLMEGLAYRALRDNVKAAARLDEALELDPEFTLAKVAKRAMRVVA